jgi:hypothetical protein
MTEILLGKGVKWNKQTNKHHKNYEAFVTRAIAESDSYPTNVLDRRWLGKVVKGITLVT